VSILDDLDRDDLRHLLALIDESDVDLRRDPRGVRIRSFIQFRYAMAERDATLARDAS
jgi:hypothetical protein